MIDAATAGKVSCPASRHESEASHGSSDLAYRNMCVELSFCARRQMLTATCKSCFLYYCVGPGRCGSSREVAVYTLSFAAKFCTRNFGCLVSNANGVD